MGCVKPPVMQLDLSEGKAGRRRVSKGHLVAHFSTPDIGGQPNKKN